MNRYNARKNVGETNMIYSSTGRHMDSSEVLKFLVVYPPFEVYIMLSLSNACNIRDD